MTFSKKLMLLAAATFVGINGWAASTLLTDQGAVKPHTIVYKLAHVATRQSPVFVQALQKIGVTSTAPYFKQATNVSQKIGQQQVDLATIFKAELRADINPLEAAKALASSGSVIYAEPIFLHTMEYTPNDPQIGQQYFLNNINAYNAWDVWKGDTNVVVAIIDSGTDWDHPDLQSQIKYNYNDPINGIDDDSDGYVDNYRGWDVSENDNSPMCVGSDHGSHVSGCAMAATDNGVGVAGPGFFCKFMPVKVSLDASTTQIDNGYDGIVYAADHGAHVINCSWGRQGGPSSFEQDVINYATFNKDALIVAAAGNNSSNLDHFPSAYANVISVASTTQSDNKSGFSNFGYTIDVCAPGSNIYTTVFNNNYTSYDGTSMASPVAAGCAAIIKSRFPSFNALQVGEQLRVTCDNIYGVSGNGTYTNQLGTGRVNLFKAITDTTSPSVRPYNFTYTDLNDDAFVSNDTVRVGCTFKNFLRPTTNATVTILPGSTAVTILQNSFTIGALGTLDSVDCYTVPFEVKVRPTAPLNAVVPMRMVITDGAYTSTYVFTLTVNVDYLNITQNLVFSTNTSKGLIGFNGANQGGGGLGFVYNSNNLLYEAGIMIGTGVNQVSDMVRDDAGGSDLDFQSAQRISLVNPGISDFDTRGVFNDNPSPSPLDISVTHRTYAWTNSPDDKYIIFDYFIKNNSGATLSNLYAGIFADWDIQVYTNNKCDEDAARKMGYAYSTDAGGLYAAIKLLNSTPFMHNAIDNIAGAGGLNLSDGFDTAEKYQSLSTNRATAGGTGTGNDVIDVVSSGPFTIAAGDSVRVSFALIAGDDLSDIQESADAAQDQFDNVVTSISSISNALGDLKVFPNPASQQATIQLIASKSGNAIVQLIAPDGKIVYSQLTTLVGGQLNTIIIPLQQFSAGIYAINLIGDSNTINTTLQVVK
ncbi:MAG: hypothetical protein RIQ89_2221 [Bacteroidota bacterium]|jgi:subtilisin family serine protease